MSSPTAARRFAVGISYASQPDCSGRSIVPTRIRNVAKTLEDEFGRERIFFDKWHPTAAHGPAGAGNLARIYRESCDLIVVFLSRAYLEKFMPRTEWERGVRCVLDERPGDVVLLCLEPPDIVPKVPGLSKQTIVIEVADRKRTGREAAEDILKIHAAKAGSATPSGGRPEPAGPSGGDDAPPPRPVGDAEKPSGTDAVRPPREADDAPDGNGSVRYGKIVVANIVDASSLRGRPLVEAVRRLWSVAAAIAGDREADAGGGRWEIAGALDSVTLAGPTDDHRRLLDACRRLIEEVEGDRSGLSVRVAVHFGDYEVLDDPARLILGRGANIGQRLVGYAGPGQIVVSQQFADEWNGRSPVSGLVPDYESQKGWTVRLRRGEPLTVFIFDPGNDEPDPSPPGRKLAEIHVASGRLTKLLHEIDEEFTGHLHALWPEDLKEAQYPQRKFAQAVRPRFSIFCPKLPDASSGELVLTEFRLQRYNNREDRTRPAGRPHGTCYEFAADGRAEGTVGRAFVDRAVHVLAGLNRRAKKTYAETLSGPPWGLPQEKIDIMGRRAQAFVSVPIGLRDDDGDRPDAVLCIDTSHAIDWPDRDGRDDVLRQIGQVIEFQYGTTLAALLRLRG